MITNPNQRLESPATARNREPILGVLRRVLPAAGRLLEVASGTGEHGAYMAPRLPGLEWQPSEVEPRLLDSIEAWRAHVGAANLLPPLQLDVTAETWPCDTVDAVFNANLVHISPWETCLGLMAGAARNLRAEGVLLLYGPFRIDGAHTAPSNASFDVDLRRRDPRWGVRDLETVRDAAAAHDLALEERVPMPANNQLLVFRRA